MEVEIEGIVVSGISRHQLKQNKRATGRPQDLADLAWPAEDDMRGAGR